MSKHISKTIPKLIAAVCAVMLVLTLSAVPAAAEEPAVPKLPMQIYGTVFDDSLQSNIASGKIVNAYVNKSLVGSFTVSTAGKIGDSGLWDDKLLIQSKDIDIKEDAEISFEVDGVEVLQTVKYQSGGSASVALKRPGDAPSPMVSAAENAASVRIVDTPDKIVDLPIPLYTNPKSGKSIPLDEGVVVTAKIGGEVKELPATIVDGHVQLTDPAPAGATDINVKFVGRKLGKVTGTGDVTLADAVKILRVSAELDSLDIKACFYGDITGDSNVSLPDAVKILRRAVELVDDNYDDIS